MSVNELMLIRDLGDNVELLLRPESYLDNQINDITSRMQLLAQEYLTTVTAKKYKRVLQNENQVAVRLLEKDSKGMIIDVVVKIVSLQEAVNRLLDEDSDPTAELQMHTIANEGYDLDLYLNLRKAKNDKRKV